MKTIKVESKARTAADAQAEIDRLVQKVDPLVQQREALGVQRADAETRRKHALYASMVEGDSRASEELMTIDAEIATLDRQQDDLDVLADELGDRIEALEREHATLVDAEAQALIDAELAKLEKLSARLDTEILPVFVRECAAWVDQVGKVSHMANLPGSRTPETQLAEALCLHFRALMPMTFRSLATIPSQARGFSDWAKRARIRSAKNIAELTPAKAG